MSNNINKDENSVYEIDLDCVKMNQCVDKSKKLYGMSNKDKNIDMLYLLFLLMLKNGGTVSN